MKFFKFSIREAISSGSFGLDISIIQMDSSLRKKVMVAVVAAAPDDWLNPDDLFVGWDPFVVVDSM